MSRPVLVSACLLGLQTRYDGACKCSSKVMEYLKANDLIPVPVCPEQLAGLPTPRHKTFFQTGDGAAVLDGIGNVINERDESMNEFFIRGARETAKVALLSGCTMAILKERSPSCGVTSVYHGDTLVKGQGVAAALLKRKGFTLRSEEEV